jgi:hypothetical protein
MLKGSKDEILRLEIPQVLSLCGNGRLLDGSECSIELRSFLRLVPSETLFRYVEPCLRGGFDKSGQVLQDLVNELGRRLDYEVENGRYQGSQKFVGFDGIWKAPTGHTLVIEVKTTDVYRINLDKLADYRERLTKDGKVQPPSSVLIVVGREDTGDLEAQVRGSRHAWDVRLISVSALMKLVDLKEDADENTAAKIFELLAPFEYTRIDKIIDLTFTAAQEVGEIVGQIAAPSGAPPGEAGEARQDRTPRTEIDALRQKILAAVEKREQLDLIRKSAALFWSTDEQHAIRIVCTVSKRYDAGEGYWYAYHSKWDAFLGEAKRGYFVLGCMDKARAFALPLDWIRQRLPDLPKTERSDDQYWHVYLGDDEKGVFFKVPNKGKLYIEEFGIDLA